MSLTSDSTDPDIIPIGVLNVGEKKYHADEGVDKCRFVGHSSAYSSERVNIRNGSSAKSAAGGL